MCVRKFFCLMLLCGALSLSFLSAQKDSYSFSGYVRSRSDSTAVSYAHVIAGSGRSFAVSNEKGFFSLFVEVGDTVFFSAVQYEPRALLITKSPSEEIITIWMRTRVYKLPEVRVYARDIMRGFFSHRRIDYDNYRARSFRSIRPQLRLGRGTDPSPVGVGVGVVVDGLLSSLLNPFTSEYRQMKRIYELRRKQQRERYYENLLTRRMSSNFVRSHLHLREEEVSLFLNFWKPEVLFLEEAEDYELIESLKEAKEKYIAHLLRTHSYRSYPDRVTTFELRELLQEGTSNSSNTLENYAK